MGKGDTKAVALSKSGPPEALRLQVVEKPAPKDEEILIRVHAATGMAADAILRKRHLLLWIPLKLIGLRRKRILGTGFAGAHLYMDTGRKRGNVVITVRQGSKA